MHPIPFAWPWVAAVIRRRQLLVGGLMVLSGGPVSLLVGCTPGPYATWAVTVRDVFAVEVQRVVSVLETLGYVRELRPYRDDFSEAFEHPTNPSIGIDVSVEVASGRIAVRFYENRTIRPPQLIDQRVADIDSGLEKEFGRERVLRIR